MNKIEILKEKIKKDIAVNYRCLQDNISANTQMLIDMWIRYDKELLEILEMEE